MYLTPYKGMSNMKSKLLRKKSYDRNRSHDVVDGQQESIEDWSVPWRVGENQPDRVNPAAGAQARFVNTAHRAGPNQTMMPRIF